MKRIALYARVSSERQAEKDLSIPAQFKLLHEWAQKNGHIVVGEYCDKAQSGRTDKRTDFQRMIADAKRKPVPFDIIACWKSSRFARNREDAVVYKGLLERHGIDVVSISEPFDDSPVGKLLEGVIEVIDDFYSRQLSQEVHRGMTEAVRQGRWPGAKPPYGYRLRLIQNNGHSYNTLEIDEATAPRVRRIFDLALKGHGLRSISDIVRAETSTPWPLNRVHYILTHPVYTGALVWNRRDPARHCSRPRDEWALLPNHHPPIVSEEGFAKVQAALRSRRASELNPRVAGSQWLLSGLVWCHCGTLYGVLAARGHGGRYHYYICNGRLKKRICDAPRLSGKKTDKAVLDALCQHVFTESALDMLVELANQKLASIVDGSAEQRAELEAQLAKADKRRQRLLDLLESDDAHFNAATLGERLVEVTTEVTRLRGDIEGLRERAKCARDIQITRSDLRAYIDDTGHLLQHGPQERLKTWLRQAVTRIDVEPTGDLVVHCRLPQDGLCLPSQHGGPCRARTCRPRIKSPVLCPMS